MRRSTTARASASGDGSVELSDEMVSLSSDVLDGYQRFSLYNSPYPAHDEGSAVDLYPDGVVAPSPVDGRVLETRTVRCPPRSYAAPEDHLLLLECGDVVARILHVDPCVERGDVVSAGDPLGRLVRSGFFGRWVDPHVHLGFRTRGQDLYRASGSLPIELIATVDGIPWDGTGTVVETGPTHVRLDAPGEATADGAFAAIASDEGVPLDGGLVHYPGGGAFVRTDAGRIDLTLFGTPVGTVDARGATGVDASWRPVSWRDVAIVVGDRRASGLSLFAGRGPFGVKVVFARGHDFAVGDAVSVTVEPSEDPTRLD